MALSFQDDGLPRAAVVIAVAAILRVAVESFRTLFASSSLGVVEAEARAAGPVADAGREVLVAVANASLTSNFPFRRIPKRPDDANVTLFARRVVKTLVAVADAVHAGRVQVAATVDAAIRA